MFPVDCCGDLPFEPFAESALDRSVTDRFSTIADHFPSRVAVQDAAIALTYAELAALVNSIAAATIAAAQGRAGPVAILLSADVSFPAAMLGVLAAGRAYVPLDAEFPIERNGVIIADAGACAIISSGHLFGEARQWLPHELPVIDIDDLPKHAETADVTRIGPDDLAAIYYTSGSSGRPKGVAWSHRNLLQCVLLHTNADQISCADRMLLQFSLSASGSYRTIYCALLNGASLHILSARTIGITALLEQIRARSITFYSSVPTLMRRLVEGLDRGDRLDSVRIVGLTGERIRWSDVDIAKRGFSHAAHLIITLASTECGPILHWHVDEALRSTAVLPPVGRPWPDREVMIVDNDGNPVADCEIGDIVISSRHIPLGYWDGAALQVRPFPPDPGDSGKRVFNTGDRGRRRPDGIIELIGRNDQQIKLHGHRIEPAEVEAALATLREVNEAAVVVRRNEAGLPRSLAAYVEPKQGFDDLTPRTLAAVLKTRLPGYMIPATIVVLDNLPRLPNLKIDREELRRYDQREAERRLNAPAPRPEVMRTKIEELLLELWCEVLNRRDIGYDDDFFLCGGDSVSAFRLMLRIEQEFQFQAPLTVLAEAPTVSQLAYRLDTMTLNAISSMICIHTVGRRRPLFAVYSAGGHALALLPVLRSLGSDQPCYWLQPPGMDWTSTECTTLPQIAAYYINQVKAVQPRGPYRLLGHGFGGHVVFEMALQLQELGETIEYLAILDTEAATCVLGDRVDVCDSRALSRKLNAQPAPVSKLEAVTRSILETHIRMTRDYVLDSKSDRNIFRGELTYLHCTGKPIVAGHDRRGMWRSFASEFRLLLVPGAYGTPDREPQYTALRNLLRSCLNDEPVSGCDPASVYDREYRMDDRYQPKNILGSMGDVHRVDQGRIQGFIDEVRIDVEEIQITGWAVEPCRRQPAQTVAVFLDDQFLGYGASGVPRPDVAERLGTDSVLFSGFYFTFDCAVAANTMRQPRLFVLSSDGSAAELRGGIEPVAIGSTKKLSNAEALGVILGGWSYREQWGVWSSGHQATVTFDASSLPNCFTVAIQANLFPPGPSPRQTVRVSDESGNLPTIISNEKPNGEFTVRMQKSATQPGPWKSLIFDIDTPISPQDLGMNQDRRKLGIGLVSLTFKK
jgi:amino acid adenylation domain-containing protein